VRELKNPVFKLPLSLSVSGIDIKAGDVHTMREKWFRFLQFKGIQCVIVRKL
jgi:hypothetical protein